MARFGISSSPIERSQNPRPRTTIVTDQLLTIINGVHGTLMRAILETVWRVVPFTENQKHKSQSVTRVFMETFKGQLEFQR